MDNRPYEPQTAAHTATANCQRRTSTSKRDFNNVNVNALHREPDDHLGEGRAAGDQPRALESLLVEDIDADVLVTVDNDADLAFLATAGRGLKGRAQSRNKGADVFLAAPSGTYIGRICHWRECRPGVRLACDARQCGRRPFLHDDLDVVTLDRGLVEAPPLELWPTVVPRARLPRDVKTQLVQPLTGRLRTQ